MQCSYDGYTATCIVTVAGYEAGYEEETEPYIYSNSNILQIAPDVTEKVFVSLYGGDAGDIDGYTWSINDTKVANIDPAGQYCLITGKNKGYTRIKVTHQKAAYPYYIGIYVFDDATKVTYITTTNNIVTMNDNDEPQRITVSLVNGKNTSLVTNFAWEVIKENNSDIPIRLDANSNSAVVTPLKSGSCTLRVTHPDASYPLDILCRVITIVKNVYIEPSDEVITLNEDDEKIITCELKNINEGEYSVNDFEYRIDNLSTAQIVSSGGNKVNLKGLANGSCKLIISHPKAKYTREVLCIVTGQKNNAVDASKFITTSQNYIRTKVGADPITLNISLKGGETGDERNFQWTVKDTATNGTGNVINLETTNGTVTHARMAQSTYTYGTAIITPIAEGTAVISVSHPKIAYSTDILVKVLDRNAILEEQLYFTGSGLVRTLNGTTYDYTVNLRGENKKSEDDHNIKWAIDDTRLSVSGNENVGTITAPTLGTGCTISHMTISHNKAEADKNVLIMTADTEEK